MTKYLLKRILHGVEARISFLWNRDEEISRIKGNSAPDAEF